MARLQAPKNGVTIRMYRQGHGDCYLLAFPRKDKRKKEAYYVMIDCGYKGGSQKGRDPNSADPKKRIPLLPNVDFKNIAESIGEATDKRIDLFIITHEHEDHVSGIQKKYFDEFTIEEAWFAWTENPNDPLAAKLDKGRTAVVNQLLGARKKLALAVGESSTSVEKLDSFISLELGQEEGDFNFNDALSVVEGKKLSRNRTSINLVRDKAIKNKGVTYWEPGQIGDLEETDNFRAFVLGPPKDKKKLNDEDPRAKEAFESKHTTNHFAFSEALTTENVKSPFDVKFGLRYEGILKAESIEKNPLLKFYADHYGHEETALIDGKQNADNADWRRIDESWLHSAENLAIKLNKGINNSSLVLAFELPKTKKTLLFVGDAQRGNWVSWTDQTWTDEDGQIITAKDILNRTVLYKVGHHGSHNATLKGEENSKYANLSWMGKGKYGKEFTAMINAVNQWAINLHVPWIHPLPSIKKALLEKAEGRVFQTDTSQLEKPEHTSTTTWQKFMDQSTFHDLYFDFTVLDEFD